jgi:hypothetical protein
MLLRKAIYRHVRSGIDDAPQCSYVHRTRYNPDMMLDAYVCAGDAP